MRKPSTILHLPEHLAGLLRWPRAGADRDRVLALLQGCLVAVAVVWVCINFAGVAWSLWPTEKVSPPPSGIANPITTTSSPSTGPQVDLDAMLGLGLFGEPMNQTDPAAATQNLGSEVPEGIEAEARETRLDLVLVGTLAESGNELGTAVIEIRGQQKPYRVGDELPIGGKVSIAKVLPQRVVLDNNGTYELLNLFDDAAPVIAVGAARSRFRTAPRRHGLHLRGRNSIPQRLYRGPKARCSLPGAVVRRP